MTGALRGRIYFSSGKQGDYDIWSLDLASGSLLQLTHGSAWNDKPHGSSDGEWVVFVSNRSGYPELYKVSSAGGEPKPLTDLKKWVDGPKFSPDGSQIAFISNESGNNDVWVMDADGGNRRRITEHPGSDSYVAWTHSGTGLLWSTDRDQDDADIWAMELSTGQKQQLTTDYGTDFCPTPSPDGSLIAFVSNRPLDPNEEDMMGDRDKDIWIMTSEGEFQLGITRNQGADDGPCWSPDGLYLLYAASSGGKASHLRVLDMRELIEAYEQRDPEKIADATLRIRSEKIDMDRTPLKDEVGARRYTNFLTALLPDSWVQPLYPPEYFGSERYPHWIAC